MNLNSEIIKQLCNNNEISIIRKSQKNLGDYNYFVSPNLTINLYGAKVIIVTRDYIVLQFSKIEKITLLSMLRTIDNYIIKYLKECFFIQPTTTIYSLFSETDTHFTLRISLPHYKYKYSIKCYNDDNNQIPFTLPYVQSILSESFIDIRNLWSSNNRIGYNLQLKKIKL